MYVCHANNPDGILCDTSRLRRKTVARAPHTHTKRHLIPSSLSAADVGTAQCVGTPKHVAKECSNLQAPNQQVGASQHLGPIPALISRNTEASAAIAILLSSGFGLNSNIDAETVLDRPR